MKFIVEPRSFDSVSCGSQCGWDCNDQCIVDDIHMPWDRRVS